MKAKNSNTNLKKKHSTKNVKLSVTTPEGRVILLHLVTNDIIVAKVMNTTDGLIITENPYEVIVHYDEFENVEGVILEPYLYPFHSDLVPFMSDNIVSILPAPKGIEDIYLESLNKRGDRVDDSSIPKNEKGYTLH